MRAQTAVIRLAVEGAAQVEGALGGVQSGLTNLGGAAGAAQRSLNTVGGALAALGVGVSLGALTGLVRESLKTADAMTKLARSTGIAVQEVAGLQLAFRQGGAEEAFKTSIAKLSKEIVGGNEAFSRMGIALRGNTGDLKSTRTLIGEVADKFATYKDGAEKTALAQELFGRAGADLIPMLNAGGQALSDFDQKAADLGLTINETTGPAAEKFNDAMDLMGLRVKGASMQIAATLLPTLTTLAEEMSKNSAQGSAFSSIGDGLAVVLEALSVIGSNVAFVFRTIARDAKLAFDFAANLATVNFSGMKPLFDTYRAETDAARKSLDEFQGAVTRARSLASAGDLDEPFVKRARAAARKAEDDAKALAITLASTEAEKKLASASAATKAARLAGSNALKLETEALRARIAAGQSANAAFDAEFKIVEAAREAIEGRIKSGREMLESIERETAMMGLSNIEREQSIALFALEKAGVIAGTEAYDAYAAKIREAISARGNKQTALDAVAAETAATAQAAKDAAAEWQKTADSINSSLTDALMRGFEDGKGFAKNLRDTLVNMFKTMILRPTISAILAPIAGGLSGAANAAGASGGGGISGLLSGASGLKNLFGGAGILGSSAAYGAAIGTTSIGVGSQAAMLAAQTSGFGAAGLGATATAAGGMGGGITAALMSIGPVGWAAIAVAALGLGGAFSRKLKDSGVQGSFGGERGFEGENFQFLKGGYFRDDKTNINPLDEEVRKALGNAFAAMRVQVGTFATALGLNTDQIAGFTSSIKLSLKGLSAEDADKKIQKALATANNALAEQVLGTFTSVTEQIAKSVQMRSGFGDSLEIWYATVNETITKTAYTASEFARDGELAIDTLKRLSGSLLVVNAVFDTLGYKLLETSLAGGDIASKLADAFGGLDQLASATSNYYEAFYSEAERTATATRQLTETLGKLGIALPNTGATDALAQYRALVDAQDINTEAGRNTYAALVTLSGGFAQLVTAAVTVQQAIVTAAAMNDQLAGLKDRYSVKDVASATRDIAAAGVTVNVPNLLALGADGIRAALAQYIATLTDTSDAGVQAMIANLDKLGPAFNLLIDEADRAANAAAEMATSAASVATALANTNQSIQDQIDVLTGAQTERSLQLRDAGDASTQALLAVVFGLQDMRTAADEAAAAALALANTNRGIQDQIDVLTGKETERSLALRDAGDDSTRALMRVVYGLQDLKTAAEATADAQRRAAEEMVAASTKATDSAFSGLERAVAAQRSAINSQLTAAQSLASEVSSIFDTLKSAVADLYRSVDSTAQQSAAQARAFITQSLSGALATGSLPDSTALQDAISAARGGMDETQFTTQFEADRARLVLAGELSQLKDIAGVQLSEAERQIKVLEDQLKALDRTLQTAREQIDVMRGIDISVISVADAITALADSLAAEAAGLAASSSVAGGGASLTDAQITAINNAPFQGLDQGKLAKDRRKVDEFQSFIGQLDSLGGAAFRDAVASGGDGTAARNAAISEAASAAGYAADLMAQRTASIFDNALGGNFAFLARQTNASEDTLLLNKRLGVPGFAVGTNRVPKDMLAQIHQGEMIVPKAFNPATSGIGNNTELVAELRELRAEVSRLRADVGKGNENTKQLADQFDSVSAGGNALATEVMT